MTNRVTAAPDGSLAPRPAAAPVGRMLAAQTAMELRLTLRRGESLLLTLVIPLGLLVTFTLLPVVSVPVSTLHRADFFVPGVLALAVMSTAFTGQAIATGYERQYGVLKRLGATALPRWVLLGAKTLGVAGVELVQAALVLGVGAALGWAPSGAGGAAGPLGMVGSALLLVVLGTAAFSGLGLLMAGTLRAEATLAGANLVWFVLLVLGGVLFPLSVFGSAGARVLRLLPTAALSDGLRAVLENGAGFPVQDVLTLVGWAVAALAAAAVTFRWE